MLLPYGCPPGAGSGGSAALPPEIHGSTQELCVAMSVIDQFLAVVAEITQYLDLFQAILVFLSFFGINL